MKNHFSTQPAMRNPNEDVIALLRGQQLFSMLFRFQQCAKGRTPVAYDMENLIGSWA
jgi:hypothetical protein